MTGTRLRRIRTDFMSEYWFYTRRVGPKLAVQDPMTIFICVFGQSLGFDFGGGC